MIRLNQASPQNLPEPRPTVHVAALGDLMLAGEWEAAARRRRVGEAYSRLRPALGDDLIFANLETAIEERDGHIPKEPRVLASPDTIRRSLSAMGVRVVSLANNHAFDGYLAGFVALREILEEQKIHHFGAGSNLEEASRPRILEHRGIRFGWLTNNQESRLRK